MIPTRDALLLFCSFVADNLCGTMMDVYLRGGKPKEAEAIFSRYKIDDASRFNILLRVFGEKDMAERATALLKSLLNDPSRLKPDRGAFNTLINSWAESSRPDTIEQAFAVFRLMIEDPRCLELGIRPDTKTFSSLLKLLVKSDSHDAGKWAEAIMNIMQSRYEGGDEAAKPDDIAYNLAIEACFRARDHDRAVELFGRMEKSDTPPDRRTLAGILNHWSSIGTFAAAERAETILSRMNESAKKDPNMKPNAFAYSSVIRAWMKSGDMEAADRVWALYEQMKAENVNIDSVCYGQVIEYLSSTKTRHMQERAGFLLQFMESSKHAALQPTFRQFMAVVNGYISIGDPETAERILLRWIKAFQKDRSRVGKIMPANYEKVFQAWLRQDNIVRAAELLYKLKELLGSEYATDGPDLQSHQNVLRAWRKSNHPEKATHERTLKATIAELSKNKKT